MGPPAVAGTSSESAQPAEHSSDALEPEDGVSSEGGEKAVSTEEEEGREAEPSTRTRSQTGRGGGVARRSVRVPHVARGAVSRSGPTPIIWGEEQRQGRQQQGMFFVLEWWLCKFVLCRVNLLNFRDPIWEFIDNRL